MVIVGDVVVRVGSVRILQIECTAEGGEIEFSRVTLVLSYSRSFRPAFEEASSRLRRYLSPVGLYDFKCWYKPRWKVKGVHHQPGDVDGERERSNAGERTNLE
jgi:hypothetical protein